MLSRFSVVEGEPNDLGLSMNMPDIDAKTREVLLNYPADVDAFPVEGEDGDGRPLDGNEVGDVGV